MPEFEQLLNKLSYLKKQDLIKVKSAYAFALDAHEGQYRKSGEPYITHPLAVASIFASAIFRACSAGLAAASR